MSDRLIVPSGMSRRHFLGHMATTALALPAMQFFGVAARPTPQQVRKKNKSCILLWMSGGPSHMDTWDLKPDSEKNGGPFKPIATSAAGRQDQRAPAQRRQADAAPEHHPLARLEGGQPRPRHLHDAHRVRPQPDGRASRASARSARTSWARSSRTSTCRTASRSTRRAWARASSGWRTRRSWCRTPTPRSPTSSPPRASTRCGMDRRLQMLGLVENNFIGQQRGQAAVDHKAVYAKTIRMMNSRYDQASSASTTSPPRSATPTARARSARAA